MLVHLIAGGLATAGVAADEAVRVMSFNIRGDFDYGATTDDPHGWLNTQGEHRRDRVIRAIKQEQPDLLGVQEALANQVDALAKALPEHQWYGVGRDDGQRAGESCALFYRTDRFERLDEGTFWLSQQPTEPGSMYPGAACTRIASWLVLRDTQAERSLMVLNTHWDHVSVPAKEFAAELIQRRLPELAGEHAVVVMGDMNSTEETPAIKTLLGGDGLRLQDSYRAVAPQRQADEATFHGFKSRRTGSRIDFILHGPQLKTSHAAIVRNAEGELPTSDHYPVTARLEWQD